MKCIIKQIFPSQNIARNSKINQDSVVHYAEGMPVDRLRTLCAVNCLYMINKIYKIDILYDDLISLLNPNDLGVSMWTLKEVAEGLGYEVKAIELDIKYLSRFNDPMVVLFLPNNHEKNLGHYVVVVPIASKRGIWIFNPPLKKQWIEQKELQESNYASMPVLLLRPR